MKIRVTPTEAGHGPFQYSAVDDNTYDGPGSPIGFGISENEAVQDLLIQIDAFEERLPNTHEFLVYANKKRYRFSGLNQARDFVNGYFETSGIILGIEARPLPVKQPLAGPLRKELA
jgi:hypothetical protein